MPYTIAQAAHAQCQHAVARGDWDAAHEIIEWGTGRRLAESGSAWLRRSHCVSARQHGRGAELPAAARRSRRDCSARTEHRIRRAGCNRGEGTSDATCATSDIEIVRRAAQAVVASPVPGTKMFKGQAYISAGACSRIPRTTRRCAEQVLPEVEALGSLAMTTVQQTDHVRGLVLETLDRIDEAVEAIEAGSGVPAAGVSAAARRSRLRLRAHPPRSATRRATASARAN